ncbi:hypothetical protein M378DRAFT_6965 [Amanita muscaria Koide BX008]|uniref:Bromo domain-containing protein n=1 Tax=Amanita muscaria (strain Koide BX008) TaxID=946122 RepID=A0A0C2X6U6_AMAMK|nr:hypothetical protein M378DRAFT_6965 [Amanita muscaria Koide BX008]
MSGERESVGLSNVESLVLAQAVWEFGGDAWDTVADMLSDHPLLSRPKNFFTSQSCHKMYIMLMKEAALPCDAESSTVVHSPENLELAQKFYQIRLEELKSLIVAEETKFKTILAEIKEIKEGRWNGQSQQVASTVPLRTGESPKTAAVEALDGSELSGFTDSPPSSETHTSDHPKSPVNQDIENATIHETQEMLQRIEPEEEEHHVEKPSTPAPTTPQPGEVETLASGDDVISQIDLDVHITTEEYPQPIQHKKGPMDGQDSIFLPSGDEPSITTMSPGLMQADTGVHDVEELKQTYRQEEEEEEEEEEEAVRPEEEEADQDQGTEILPPSSEPPISPAHVEIAEDVKPPHDIDDQPQVEQKEPAMTGDEPQLRRSRRQRSSVSTAPQIQRKITGVRRSRRISEATEPDPTSPEEGRQEIDVVMEDSERTHPLSPANDESSSLRKRKASLVESIESPRDRKRLRDDSEPVEDDEPGPSPAAIRGKRRGDKTEEQVALKRFQNVIGMLHAQISQHRNGNIFHNPIKTSDASDYHEIVKRPIDLKTIKGRVKDGLIANSLEYQRDIYLMFANAMMYNVPGSDVHGMAEDMMLESEAHVSSFRQTEGLVRRL